MAKKNDLTAFKRVWSYVRPQWARVVAVVFWSILIAMMFAVSFMTILPLLKVMMNEEGLHGWVDRKTIEWRYGLNLAIPDPIGQSGNDLNAFKSCRNRRGQPGRRSGISKIRPYYWG